MAKARLGAVEQQLQELKDELKREQKDLRLFVERSFSEFGQRLGEICRRLDESAPNPNGGEGGVKEPMHQGRTQANAQNSLLAFRSMRSIDHLPRSHRGLPFEIPKFGGDNPRSWIMKCEGYFLANPMPDVEKMLLASMYMEGRAKVFYMNYIEGREQVGWGRFAEMVVRAFSDPVEQDLVGAFNKLEQESSVEVYREKFEELKYFMVQSSYGTFTEDYFVQSFLSGLKLEIRLMVEMLKPTTLDQAIHLAKLRESSLEFTVKDLQTALEDYSSSSDTENVLETALEDDSSSSDTEKDLHTSVHALDGRSPPKDTEFTNTIKLTGKAKNVSFSIIVVTGSPQSFLDTEAAKRIGCKLEYTNPLLFTMANGGRLDCSSVCRGFEWEMGNHIFMADVMIMKLGGCDMIIGVDILRDWGGVTFDLVRRRITVQLEDEEIILQEETKGETREEAYLRVLTCDNSWNR